MEAGGMVVVDGVAEFVEMTKSRRCSGSVIRYRLSDRSLRPLQEPHLERVARIVTERYCRPVRTASSATRDGSTTIASRRNCSRGGVLLRAKGWGVEVAGRAVRLFDPWLSESIRCGFPEIPKPGRSRRRKGRRAGRGRKALRRVRSAVPGGFARGSPLRLSDGRSSFACGRVFWSRASILDSGLPDDPARSGTGRISRAAGTSCREVGGQD